MADIRVGIFAPVGAFASRVEPQSVGFVRIAESAVDHVCVGDHVSFHVGAGADALIDATSVLTTFPELPCYVALYLLPLRHPVLVARQLASIAELAPGRLTLGVGIGGEDPHELEICGVDPRTVGRRMDESLQILRALSDGTPVSFDGEFFRLHDALILPAPTEAIPIVVGGRSDAAVRRAGRFGDGWLGIWVSPKPIRFGGRTSCRARCARRQGSRRPLSMRSTCGAGSATPATPRANHSLPECRTSTGCRSSRSSVTRPTGRRRKSPSSLRPTLRPAARCSTSFRAPVTMRRRLRRSARCDGC